MTTSPDSIAGAGAGAGAGDGAGVPVTDPAAFAVRAWLPPEPGPAVRGTVILLPGRGEHAGVYERFGRRLAFDAYAVYALDVGPRTDPADLRDQVTTLAAGAVAPVVLAGSDTGALHALALVTEAKVDVEGVLLAAIPAEPGVPRESGASDALDASAETPGWEQELALRTSCPTHRGRLAEDAAFTRGSLFEAVPDRLGGFLLLDESEYEGIGATLVLHGGADLLAPPQSVRAFAGRLPGAQLALVAGAPHDVLNDATHRSVAAVVVQWLERLRTGFPAAAIVELG